MIGKPRGAFAQIVLSFPLLMAAAITSSYAQISSAPQLLMTADAAEGSALMIEGRPARQRLVKLSVNALHAAIAPGGIDYAENRVAESNASLGRIALQLFPNIVVTFRRESVEAAFGGGFVWNGLAEGTTGSTILVTKNDQVTGHVEVGGRIYRIEPLNGQMHRVVEVDLNAMPTDAPHLIPPRAPRDSHDEIHDYATSTEAATTAPVDLLVLYTGRANNAPGDILSDINLAVKLTNQAFSNSGIRTRVRLVGTMLVVGYDEAAYSYAATLYNLTNMAGGGATTIGRNAFRGGRLRRDQLRADLVALVREGGPYCGQAWVIEQPSTSTSAYGYAQLSRACIPDFVMAHELGHTMGLLHDRYVEASAPAAKYNFGYVNVSNRVRDVMSYSNLCAARRVLCTRVNRFSNPRITVAGLPFGIRAGVAGAADASRRLNETYPYVVRFR